MSDRYVTRLTSSRQILETASAFAAPAGHANMFAVDELWRDTGLLYLELDAASAVDLTGAYLLGYEPKAGKVRQLGGDLNNGATITLGAQRGREFPFYGVAGMTKFKLVGTLSAVVLVTVSLTPAEHNS